jgi:hypothetical protein
MNHHNFVFALTAVGLLSLIGVANAEEYVWARTAWGASNINARYSSMGNGYGGYYVPKSAVGNNYESQGNFRNPNGYIIPGNSGYAQQPTQSFFHTPRRRLFR